MKPDVARRELERRQAEQEAAAVEARRREAEQQGGGGSTIVVTGGNQTGIAVSQCALGEGVNADNIKKCLALLRDSGYTGVLSMECEGQGGPMIEKSLAWLRKTLKELGIAEEN